MDMTYMQIFADKEELLEPLTREDKGELMDALFAYAFHDTEIPLETNARFVWPIFRQMINQSRKSLAAKSNARKSKDANQTESSSNQNVSEPNQTESDHNQNVSDGNQTESNDHNNKNQESRIKIQDTEIVGANAPTTRARARDARFDMFWANYPKKVGKVAAQKAFDKIRPSSELFSQMLTAIKQQRASPQWTRDNGQYIPNPATWLNQGRWDDEPAAAPAGGGAPETSNIFLRMLIEEEQNAKAGNA